MPDPTGAERVRRYRVTLSAPAGPVTLDLLASSRTGAILSAQELTGLGRRATVARCARLGDW